MSQGAMSFLKHLNEGVGDGHSQEELFAAGRAGLRVAIKAAVVASALFPTPPSITQAKPAANQHPPRCSRKEPLSEPRVPLLRQ